MESMIEEIGFSNEHQTVIEKGGLTSAVLDDIPVKKVVNSKNAYLRKFPYNDGPTRKIQYGIIVTVLEEYKEYYRIDPTIIFQSKRDRPYCWIAKTDLRDPVVV